MEYDNPGLRMTLGQRDSLLSRRKKVARNVTSDDNLYFSVNYPFNSFKCEKPYKETRLVRKVCVGM